MTTGERYMVRKQISNLYREAKAYQDRANEEDHIKALRLRAEANDLNEELKATRRTK